MEKNYVETRAQSGYGAALLVNDPDDTRNPSGKYSLLVPLETIPSVFGSVESFEFDLTTMATKGKVIGKSTIDDKDVEFLLHRDNVYRLSMFKDKTVDLLYVTADGLGYKYVGTIKVRPNDLSGDVAKGTMTLTCQSVGEDPIMDVRPLIMPTVTIINTVNESVDDLTTTATKILVETDVALSAAPTIVVHDTTATGEGSTSSSQMEGSAAAPTGDTSNKKWEVSLKQSSGATSGTHYGIAYITCSASNCAPWTTTVRVSTTKA